MSKYLYKEMKEKKNAQSSYKWEEVIGEFRQLKEKEIMKSVLGIEVYNKPNE